MHISNGHGTSPCTVFFTMLFLLKNDPRPTFNRCFLPQKNTENRHLMSLIFLGEGSSPPLQARKNPSNILEKNGCQKKNAPKRWPTQNPPPGGLAVLFLLCIVAMIACECLALRRRKSAMEKAGVAKARARDRRIEGLNRDAVTSSLFRNLCWKSV